MNRPLATVMTMFVLLPSFPAGPACLPLARSAKTTDVPSQSRVLATKLARGGVKFMHIGCNWPSGYVHNLPPIFWWQGPDGSPTWMLRFLMTLFRCGVSLSTMPSIGSWVGFRTRTASRFLPPARIASLTSSTNGNSPPLCWPMREPFRQTSAR